MTHPTEWNYDSLLGVYGQGGTGRRQLFLKLLVDVRDKIIDGDINHLQSVCKALLTISCTESVAQLQSFLHDPDNPFAGTNIVIFTCKLNQHDVLAYFLDQDEAVLSKLYEMFGLEFISPEMEDSSGHTAFYYAIRSNQVKTVELLIQRWPGSNMSHNKKKVNDLISQSYAELMVVNVDIDWEMEMCIEGILVAAEYLPRSKSKVEPVKITAEDVAARVDFLIEKIMTFLGDEPTSGTELNVFQLRNIARSIHFLKNALMATYMAIPWEEIEFCVVMSIIPPCSMAMIPTSQNERRAPVCYWILTEQKLKEHLTNFLECIQQEMSLLVGTNVNELHNPAVKRQVVVDSIIEKHPKLISLYEDYEVLRDLKSMDIIRHYVTLSEKVDPEEVNGKFVILRMIQVLVECLKNTLESPKMSEGMSKLLLSCIPQTVRDVLLEFRNSSPHYVSQMVDIEMEANSSFIAELSRGCHNMKEIIEKHFYYKTLQEVRSQLKILENCEDRRMIADIIHSFQFCKLDPHQCFLKDFKYYESLIEKVIPDELCSYLPSGRYMLSSHVKHSFLGMLSEIEPMLQEFQKICSSSIKLVLPTTWEMIVDGSEGTIRRVRHWAKSTLAKMFGIAPKYEEAFAIGADLLKLTDTVAKKFTTKIYLEVFKSMFEILQLVTFVLGENASTKEIDEKFSVHNKTFPLKSEGYPIEIIDHADLRLSSSIASLKCVMKNQDLKTLSRLKNSPSSLARLEVIVMDILYNLNSRNCLCRNVLSVESRGIVLVGERLLHHLEHIDDISSILYNQTTSLLLNAKELLLRSIGNSKIQVGNSTFIDIADLREIEEKAFKKVLLQSLIFDSLLTGSLSDVKECVESGADVRGRGICGSTAVHSAAFNSNQSLLKYVMAQCNSRKNHNSFGETPLHFAAKSAAVASLQVLIQTMAADELDTLGRTPLHLFSGKGDVSMLQLLLSHRADPKRSDNFGDTPIKWALFNDQAPACKVLLEAEKSCSTLSHPFNSSSTLSLAAEVGSVEIVRYILNEGTDSAMLEPPLNPLCLSVENGHLEVTKLLLAKKFDVSAKAEGRTPLHCAVSASDEDTVKLLLQHGASVNVTDADNMTPLCLAASKGNTAIVKILLDNRARVNVRNNEGKTPLHLAALMKHHAVLKLILEYSKTSVNAQTISKFTPLHYSACNGDLDSTKLLVKHRAQLYVKNFKGHTALFLAAARGLEEVVAFLLESGASVNSSDNEKSATPLHLSASCGRGEAVRILLEKGARVDALCEGSTTPLLLASTSGDIQSVQLLLEKQSCVNSSSSLGLTPIHHASSKGFVGIIECLLESGANANQESNTGDTALHFACEGGSIDAVRLLIESGCNVNAVTKTGYSPLDVAVEENHKDVVVLLLNKKAQVKWKTLTIAVIHDHDEIMAMLLDHFPQSIVINNQLFGLACARFDENPRNEILKMLLQKGAKVNEIPLGKSNWVLPLHKAASYNNPRGLQILISHGGNPTLTDSEGLLPLHKATHFGQFKAAIILLRHSPNVMKDDTIGSSLLALAILYKRTNLVKLFLSYTDKLAIMYMCMHKKPLLHLAAKTGELEVVKMLVEKGADINYKTEDGSKAIHIAAKEGFPSIVKYFLSVGMSLYTKGSDGKNVLHYVAPGPPATFDVAKMLVIEKNMDVNKANDQGLTPLLIAGLGNDPLPVVRLLLNRGAIYNKHSKDVEELLKPKILSIFKGVDDLFNASKQGDLKQVKRCLLKENIVNVRNVQNETPLLCASLKGHDEVVNTLLSNGADPNLTGKSGSSPLHVASKHSHFQIVLSLLGSGAYFGVLDSSNKTPLEYATDEKIVTFLILLEDSFMKVKSGDVRVTTSLCEIKWESKELKAFLNGRDSEGKTLLATAMLSEFPDIGTMKYLFFKNVVMLFSGDINVKGLEFPEDEVDDDVSEYDEDDKPICGKLLAAEYMYSFSSYLAKKGEPFRAFIKCEILFNIFKELLGDDSKPLLKVKSFMGSLIDDMGVPKKALGMLKDVFDKQSGLLDVSHPDLLSTQVRLSLVLCHLGRFDEAAEVTTELLEKLEQKYGSSHCATLKVQEIFVSILTNQNRHTEALEMAEGILGKRSKVSGQTQDTLTTMECILAIHLAMKHEYDALKICSEMRRIVGKESCFTHFVQELFREPLQGNQNIVGCFIPGSKFPNLLHLLEGLFGGKVDPEAKKCIDQVLKDNFTSLKEQGRCQGNNVNPNPKEDRRGEKKKGNFSSDKGKSKKEKKCSRAESTTEEGGRREKKRKVRMTTLEERSNRKRKTSHDEATMEEPEEERSPEKKERCITYPEEESSGRKKNEGSDTDPKPEEESKVKEDGSTGEQLCIKDVLCSISAGDESIIERMLNSGFDFNTRDGAGRTPLHFAVSKGSKEMVARLIKNGANVSFASNRDNTAFHLAASSGKNELMELLIQNIEEGNECVLNRVTTNTGMTALHVAASRGHGKVVETLLKNGAQFNVLNKDGKTPLDVSISDEASSILVKTAQCFDIVDELTATLKRLNLFDCAALLNSRRSDGVTLHAKLNECLSFLKKLTNLPDEDK